MLYSNCISIFLGVGPHRLAPIDASLGTIKRTFDRARGVVDSLLIRTHIKHLGGKGLKYLIIDMIAHNFCLICK